MGSMEDRTFRVNFTGDGADKLRAVVKDKLKEFMGDYTDDTLVEYVIVLLRNGRRKEEARSELDVFLGDDSDSFVSWLWDHLTSNLDLYVHPQDTSDDAKTKPTKVDQARKNEPLHLNSEIGKKPDNLTKARRKREWKAMTLDATEPPPLRSSEIDNMCLEERCDPKVHRTRRSPSPQHHQQKKRSRQDERHHLKKEEVSHATINAPRRLLQFAVRDAVGTLRPSGLVKEPSTKRLHSVVSKSTSESPLVEPPRRIQSIARLPNPMATVIKAVQEAAEDVIKVQPSRNVFDRLGRGMDTSESMEQIGAIGYDAVEDEESGELNQHYDQNRPIYLHGHDHAVHGGDSMEREAGLAGDAVFDNEVYDDDDVMGHGTMDVSETGPSGGIEREDSLVIQYNIARSADDMLITLNKDRDQPVSAPKATANISMGHTRKSHYQGSRGAPNVGDWNSGQANGAHTLKSRAREMKENNNPMMVDNGNAKPAADIQPESQKTVHSAPASFTARPLEDADSRTIFVSNVHFAATKDNLSRHFNKFGDVLKVLIVTDVATGQPKGSAYVEFMRKEAADNALSLDGTSFMSRILKVVKKSPANQEATVNMTWPRATRGSPYAIARFSRAPFPRGSPSAFRPRLPIKPGARSFQWKRDAQGASAEIVAPVSGSLASPTVRSLTYVRAEPKPEANLGST